MNVKVIVLFLVSTLMVIKGNAQKEAHNYSLTTNKAYLGITNIIDVVENTLHFKHVELTTDNGSLHKLDMGYSYVPKEKGESKFIFRKYNWLGVLKYEQEFHVDIDSMPKPKIFLCNSLEGPLSKKELAVQPGIVAKWDDDYLFIDVRFSVKEYNLIILRNSEIFFRTKQSTPLFTEDVINALKQLQSNDVLIFNDLSVMNVSTKKVIHLEPVIFSIK